MIAWFDIVSGISGDMTLGAFVDLGVPIDWLMEHLTLLPIEKFDLRCENILQNGIKVVNLFVDIDNDCHTHKPHGDIHSHDTPQAHTHKFRGDIYTHIHTQEGNHPVHTGHQNSHVRDYREIKRIISEAELPSRVKSLSLSAFEKIAIAESKIHGLDMDNVHFHEVGAVDSIVDIVGSFLCVDFLGITDVYASHIPLGKGFVKCSHGILPVPAPAVLSILKGIPIKDSNIEMELVTPTGAAIIATLVSNFGSMPHMVIDNVGYGSGKNTNDSDIPNFLRIVTGTKACGSGLFLGNESVIIEDIFVVETSIDDMIPEIAGYIMEKLFEKGALDVCHIPVQMKKNRPGIRLEVICSSDKLKDIINLILNETTTLGVRYHKVKRACLKRQAISIDTCFGKIQAKEITGTTGEKRMVPEYEACCEIAAKRNLPLRDVYTQVCLDINHGKIL